jgi:hypothetical protein
MSYGIELYSEKGELTYSPAMTTWHFIDSFIVGPGQGKVVTLSRIFSDIAIQKHFMTRPVKSRIGNQDVRAITPTISISGLTITVSPNGTVPILVMVLGR